MVIKEKDQQTNDCILSNGTKRKTFAPKRLQHHNNVFQEVRSTCVAATQRKTLNMQPPVYLLERLANINTIQLCIQFHHAQNQVLQLQCTAHITWLSQLTSCQDTSCQSSTQLDNLHLR